MSSEPPFGGAILIADTSARIRTTASAVHELWLAAVAADQIRTCTVVTLEMSYSGRDEAGVAEIHEIEASFRQVPVTASAQRAAIAAVRELSQRGAGAHRIPPPDILIAAAAQEAGIGVLHYDRHYDRLAEVLSFDSVWIAPPGSL